MARHPLYDRIVPVISELVNRAGKGFSRGPGLLVAISGGPDSVAVLRLAHTWGTEMNAPVAAAHLNHQLRGTAADTDESFCQELCRRLAIPLHVHRVDPRPAARQRGMGLEEAARTVRREFLAKLLERMPAFGCAATGHHRDDQTETVIMRLFRGTGLDGLAGIPAVSGRIIHPLLEVSRREILDFLEAESQSYRLDATNETADFTRSQVRRRLLPLAREIFGGGADTAPARLAKLAAKDTALLNRWVAEILADLTSQEESPPGANRPVRLPLEPLRGLDPALVARVFRQVFKAHDPLARDIGQVHLDGLLIWLKGCRSGSSVDLPHGWKVGREFDDLWIFPPAAAGSGSVGRGSETAPCLSPAGSYRILVLDDTDSSLPGGTGGPAWRIQCPRDALRGRLRLRPWREGDRIDLLGLGGHKKVSDLLRERRIGVSQRPAVMVVEDDAGLLWIVGLGRSRKDPGVAHEPG